MKVKNDIFCGYDTFDLDAGAFEMKSVNSSRIKLPYTGELPEQMQAQSACIELNVQLVQGPRLVLEVHLKNGRHTRLLVEASTEEITSLLDSFFGFAGASKSPQSTGLDDYWLGLWQAHYIEWNKIASQPYRIMEIIATLSDKDKRYIQQRISNMLNS